MKQIKFPNQVDWNQLIKRPSQNSEDLQELVRAIFEQVQTNGDKALMAYTKLFDKVTIDNLIVTKSEIEGASTKIDELLKSSIQLAKLNIEKFHRKQQFANDLVETTIGVTCWRESRPIENVGMYIPGGTAPLFSSVLMLGTPAQIAGCRNIILCTPPDEHGEIHPAILYAAELCGITKIYKVGGIQAIAAMSIGTESIIKVDKVFGPGNKYVTAAKKYAQIQGVAIDLPAGPSEVLIIADEYANPKFVAADLLAQAEHGADSQVILASNNKTFIDTTIQEIKAQIKTLPRKDVAKEVLKNSKTVLLNTVDECIAMSNEYAPEHLVLALENPNGYVSQIDNAGAVFLGNYSCESAGDYVSGLNHILPTNGAARSYSGVSLDSYMKKITFQEISEEGIRNLAPSIIAMSSAEGLDAHGKAVEVRMEALNKKVKKV